MKHRLASILLSSTMVLSMVPNSVIPSNATEFEIGSNSFFDGDDFIVSTAVRDFKADGLLFEGVSGGGKGLVTDFLDIDGSPIYDLDEWHRQVSDKITWDMLYKLFPMDGSGGRDNLTFFPMRFEYSGDGYYDVNYHGSYFPIDNQVLGNEGRSHNYGFSTMVNTGFYYYPGKNQTLTVGGDDDVWVYVNGVLVIDLGGKHSTKTETVNMDDLFYQGRLFAEPGDYVYLNMFQVERQSPGSDFVVHTNVAFKEDPNYQKPSTPDIPENPIPDNQKPDTSNPTNLLINPSAENGMTGWTDPEDQWITDNGSGTTKTTDGGSLFWPGKKSSSESFHQIYQDVTLPGTAGTIDLSAWVAAYPQSPFDYSGIVLQVFDRYGKQIGESSASNESLDPNWNKLHVSGDMTAGIYKARVILQGYRNAKYGDCDSYFDNLELTFKNKDGSYYTPTGNVQPEQPSKPVKPSEPTKPVKPSVPDTEVPSGNKIGHHSDWADKELNSSSCSNLIPACLEGKDLTRTINRTEFAAVAVKLYENISGKKAQMPVNNPFFDTDDPEVLKAFALGIINGTGEGTFSPSDPLTREQAAVILVRAYQAACGHTLENKNSTLFADHDDISVWARDAVYTMAAYGVINGVGENRFAPKGHASREQAVIIAGRSTAKINH